MKKITMRDSFFGSVYRLAQKDKNIIVVSADMGAPGLDEFRRNLRRQFVNVGIAEQNLITVATGLALSGKKVFIYAIIPFITSRCFEMIKVDLSLMDLPVTVVGVGAGFSYDESGPTHHATEDIALLRILPNMTIFSPSDSVLASCCAQLACRTLGPSYIRLDRHALPQLYSREYGFSQGLSMRKKGKGVCIVATGNMVHRALEVSLRLKKQGVDAGVVDLYRLKPINEPLLLNILKKAKAVVTLEEHLVAAGIGSLIGEILLDAHAHMPLKRIGIKDRYYYAYGGRDYIQSICGLDVHSVTETISNWLQHIS